MPRFSCEGSALELMNDICGYEDDEYEHDYEYECEYENDFDCENEFCVDEDVEDVIEKIYTPSPFTFLAVVGERNDMISFSNRSASLITCPICLEDFPPHNSSNGAYYPLVKVPDCEHVYCVDCIKNHCETSLGDFQKLKNRNVFITRQFPERNTISLEQISYGIPCPDPSCKHLISQKDLHSCFGRTPVTLRFDALVENDIKFSKPGLKFCPICHQPAAPDALAIQAQRRQYPQTHHTMGVPCRCSSTTCRQAFCSSCSSLPHLGKTCSQANRIYQRQIRKKFELALSPRLRLLLANPMFLEVALAGWLAEATSTEKLKCCPKCSEPIEKNLGCDHMHCTKCQLDFSWKAAPAWKPKNSVLPLTKDIHLFKKSFQQLSTFYKKMNDLKQKAELKQQRR